MDLMLRTAKKKTINTDILSWRYSHVVNHGCVVHWPAPFPVFTGGSARTQSQIPVGVLPSLVSTFSQSLTSFGLYSFMNASNNESVVHDNEIICCDWGLGEAMVESNLQFPLGDKGVFPKILINHSWWKMPLTINKWSIILSSISELIAMTWWSLRVLKSSVYCSI